MNIWVVVRREDDWSGNYPETYVVSAHRSFVTAEAKSKLLDERWAELVEAYLVPLRELFAKYEMAVPRRLNGQEEWLFFPWELRGCRDMTREETKREEAVFRLAAPNGPPNKAFHEVVEPLEVEE